MLLSERAIILEADVDSALRYWFIREHALLNISINGAAAFCVCDEVAYYHLRRLDALVAVPC